MFGLVNKLTLSYFFLGTNKEVKKSLKQGTPYPHSFQRGLPLKFGPKQNILIRLLVHTSAWKLYYSSTKTKP
jgi:hypothetical protein